MTERLVVKTMAARGALMVLLSLVIVPLLGFPVSGAGPIPGVVLDCDDMNPEMIVHPEQLAPVTITCTIENNSLYKEEIKLDSEIPTNTFAISLSPAGPHDIDAGDTATVMVTFAGSARMDAESIEFDLMATVITVTVGGDPINIPWEAAGATSNKSGTITSMEYHKAVLDMNDKSSRDMASGEEEILTFSLLNDGNADNDQFEVGINEDGINALENAGFKFVGDPFVRFTLSKGSMVNSNITILAPESVSAPITIEIKLEAKSLLDSDMENVESISLTIKADKSSGGVGGISIEGLNSLSDDDIKIYSAFGAGIVILLLLVIVISKITKKGNKHENKTYAEDPPLDVVKDVAVNNDIDFDFDDLDLDDVDAELADLDDIDEFDFEDL